ncbi:segregation/condensation protein A [bacterium]|nr:segregation/condensation protein A [bacterium]
MTDTIEITNQDYKINLDVFEGPMDLLLHLIKKNDVDIYDIPIAFIAGEYLKYIDSIQEMDIDLAGEFLVMAAELAQIKSKMLLPTVEGQEEEEEDPRTDLVRRLLEYQRYKEVAEKLANKCILNRDIFKQGSYEKVPTLTESEIEASVYNLVEAFSRIVSRASKDVYHEISVDRVSVSEKIFQIIELIKDKERLKLEDLLTEPLYKHIIVITFLALLEMCKLKMIKVFQLGNFESIEIEAHVQNVNSDNFPTP